MAWRRVGRTPEAWLEWAVGFAQHDPASVTPAEWAKYQEELTGWAFLGDRTMWAAAFSEEAPQLFPLDVVREAQREFHRILTAYVTKGRASIGRFTLDFEVIRIRGAQVHPTLFRWLERHAGQWFSTVPRPALETPNEAIRFSFGLLLRSYGYLVRVCPAPAPRGAPGQTCGRWFFADRSNKTYCDRLCQSRATTRAARARAKQRTQQENERRPAAGRRRRPTGGK